MTDALEGVTGVEFGSFAAGPGIGKYLANFGARVIHVESVQRPDGLRTHYPPFKDDKAGLNRAGAFAFWNDSKYGVTLNLKHPQGLALAHQLVEKSDFVIENMRPGVMARLGLGYDELRKRNPRLVLLSTSNMGQTGPYADHPGFGSQLSSLSGFSELIGREDGPPLFIYGPYIDLIAVAYGGIAVLAALDHQRRTGEVLASIFRSTRRGFSSSQHHCSTSRPTATWQGATAIVTRSPSRTAATRVETDVGA